MKAMSFLGNRDLCSLRLTSKALNEIATDVLFHTYTIALRRHSLDTLLEISKHPFISKMVKEIVFDISRYNLATREEYGLALEFRLTREFFKYWVSACDNHRTKIGYPRRSMECQYSTRCNIEKMVELKKITPGLKAFQRHTGNFSLFASPQAQAIERGYQRYCQLLKEQEIIAASDEHVDVLRKTLSSLPNAKILVICNIEIPTNRRSITTDYGPDHLAFCLERTNTSFEKDLAFLKVDKIMQAWEYTGSNLYQLKVPEAKGLMEICPAAATFSIKALSNHLRRTRRIIAQKIG